MKLSDREKEIVLMLARCNMNVLETSRKLYMRRHNVAYRLERIEQSTGLDPKNFYDLVKLVEAASGQQMQGGRTE